MDGEPKAPGQRQKAGLDFGAGQVSWAFFCRVSTTPDWAQGQSQSGSMHWSTKNLEHPARLKEPTPPWKWAMQGPSMCTFAIQNGQEMDEARMLCSWELFIVSGLNDADFPKRPRQFQIADDAAPRPQHIWGKWKKALLTCSFPGQARPQVQRLSLNL